MIPSRKEVSKFMSQHPFLSIAFTVAGAFTIYETMNAITAPKGQGPFSMGGLGMSKAQIMAKHPKGTKQSHINSMHENMKSGMEFGPAHNQAIKDGHPALGSYLGASTSTSSSSSTSHAMMDRPLTEDIMPSRRVGHSDFFGINHHVIGASNLGSSNLPPAMRRRISQRQRGTGPVGTYGNVALDYEDNVELSNYDAVGNLYGLGGMSPEAGTGWTE